VRLANTTALPNLYFRIRQTCSSMAKKVSIQNSPVLIQRTMIGILGLRLVQTLPGEPLPTREFETARQRNRDSQTFSNFVQVTTPLSQ
jgi:hypothetical protein